MYYCRYRKFELDVLAGTTDGEMYIWDFRSKELLHKVKVHSQGLYGVCFLSEDRVVTVSEDGNLIVTDLSVLHSVSFDEPTFVAIAT